MATRILLAGGGTGGHVYPLVAVAEELKKSGDVQLQFIGDGALLKREAAALGVKFRQVLAPKWRRYFSPANLLDVWKLPLGILQAFFHLWVFMPDVIFVKGGYASFLPALIGRLFLIPLVVHESDAVPGWTNLFFGKKAKKVLIAFEAARKYFPTGTVEFVGNPIRSQILVASDGPSAKTHFSLDPAKPTVLITGASQGAQPLNGTLLLAAVELVKKFQIIHQTGPDNFAAVEQELKKIMAEGENSYGPGLAAGYRLYPAFEAGEMALAYSAADVVVCRAGSSIFEIAAHGKPLVLVPLPHAANGHQLANAREAAKFGAIIIEQANLTPHILINEIENACQNRQSLGGKIKELARVDAAAAIANLLLNF